MTNRIQVIRGDITELQVDAIVNAANEGMLGGGGVDGAIHRAAGPELLTACREFPAVRGGGRCPTGKSRITLGYELPARFVIHTVGPIWGQAGGRERELLAACYRSSLHLAVSAGIRTIAFPAISCGIYHFPIDEAAEISVRTIQETLNAGAPIEQVILVAFDNEIFDAWSAAVDSLKTRP